MDKTALDQIIKLVQDEPEYPDPCPIMKEYIKLVAGDEEGILELIRLSVEQTKRCIIERLLTQYKNGNN